MRELLLCNICNHYAFFFLPNKHNLAPGIMFCQMKLAFTHTKLLVVFIPFSVYFQDSPISGNEIQIQLLF